jgi:hypothetical protein
VNLKDNFVSTFVGSGKCQEWWYEFFFL